MDTVTKAVQLMLRGRVDGTAQALCSPEIAGAGTRARSRDAMRSLAASLLSPLSNFE